MCRYTPCVISLCSGRFVVWIRCVKDAPAVTCAALRKPSPSTAHASPAILIARAASPRFSSGASTSSSAYSSTANDMATQYGVVNRKLSRESVARLYARAMAYSETWYTNSDAANARASHGTRSIVIAARGGASLEREL